MCDQVQSERLKEQFSGNDDQYKREGEGTELIPAAKNGTGPGFCSDEAALAAL